MSQKVMKEILTKYRTIAVVGLSRDPSKASYRVAEYLKNHGYKIIPVNPLTDAALGEKSYKSLLETPVEVQKAIEVVDVFRPAAEVQSIVDQAIQLKRLHGVPYVMWMQLGIVNEKAAETAKEAGLTVVMDECMMQQHRKLFG